MISEKDSLPETQRDISYINEIRIKNKKTLMDTFSNRQINQSTLVNEKELSFLNKVR